MAELLRRYHTKKTANSSGRDSDIFWCVKTKVSCRGAQMSLKLAADGFQKVRDAEPEVGCGWSWGAVELRECTGFFQCGDWFIHTNFHADVSVEFDDVRSSYTTMLPASG